MTCAVVCKAQLSYFKGWGKGTPQESGILSCGNVYRVQNLVLDMLPGKGLGTIVGQTQVLISASVEGWQRTDLYLRCLGLLGYLARIDMLPGKELGQGQILISATVAGWQQTDRIAELEFLGLLGYVTARINMLPDLDSHIDSRLKLLCKDF